MYSWGKQQVTMLKQCKENVIHGHSSYFGSTGCYYSFGNRSSYGMIDKSTITQYTNKKHKGKKIGKVKTYLSQVDALYMESIASKQLNHSIKSVR